LFQQPLFQSPHIEIKLLASKYAQPLKLIGCLDTGAQKSMINRALLPPTSWTKTKDLFLVANGEIFGANLISKHKIGIQLFPRCIVWLHVYGNPLHGKDVLIGWDCYSQAKHLRLMPHGLSFQHELLPFSSLTHVYSLSTAPAQYHEITAKLKLLCAKSHADFHHPKPLWKNEEFFVKLPFKLNEDINPTKASHIGMTPNDLKLAQDECSQLLKLGLIEPTTSSWACQAFYVNKRVGKDDL
jgi:hypothetical protein